MLTGDGEPGNAVTKEEILVMVFTNSEVFRDRGKNGTAIAVS